MDIAAPGDVIAAVCLSPDKVNECPGVTRSSPGTSFAAPHVAGVAAMVLQLDPDLKDNAAALRSKLINSGVKSTKLDGGLTALRPTAERRVCRRHRAAVRAVRARACTQRLHDRLDDGIDDHHLAGSTDASGIESYRVRYRKVGVSTWTTITSATTSQSASATLTTGRATRSRSPRGTVAATRPPRSVTTTPTRYSESSPTAHYSGTWSLSSNASFSGGKARTTSTAGRSVTYTFTGRSAAWVSAKSPTRGSAKVYVDGTYVTTVNLHTTTTAYRRVVWTRSWGQVGTHSVKFVVSGTAGHPEWTSTR